MVKTLASQQITLSRVVWSQKNLSRFWSLLPRRTESTICWRITLKTAMEMRKCANLIMKINWTLADILSRRNRTEIINERKNWRCLCEWPWRWFVLCTPDQSYKHADKWRKHFSSASMFVQLLFIAAPKPTCGVWWRYNWLPKGSWTAGSKFASSWMSNICELAQLNACLWFLQNPGFELQKGQAIYLFSKTSKPFLGPMQFLFCGCRRPFLPR